MKAFLANFLGHAAGAIVSLAGIVAAINPAIIPAPWGFVTAIAGLVVTVAHGAHLNGVTVGQAVAAAATAAQTAVTKAPVLLAALVLAGASVGGLSACATLESPSSAPYVQVAVDVAVTEAEAKGITAAQINAVAKQALAADQGSGATLAAVAALVQREIAALKLPAGDQAAADLLVAALSASIQAQVSGNATLAQTQTAAAVVIQDVITATGG